jgi:tetratricopeptide (TPR) repeat protein
VKQGEKLNNEGKQDDALGLYRQALQTSPNLYEAHLASGIALDLEGKYAEARQEFSKAIEVAPADAKQQALRSMAFSYAFEKNATEAAKFEQQVFDARLSGRDFIGAAEIADEVARIYLESGDTANAHKWYQTGYETAQKKTDLTEAEKNLWVFRWENAQARIDAREGKATEAQQHVAAAKNALDKANNPDQARFYPYLTGYVAFYGGDYKSAIADLQKADQRDPFILVLLAQAYEKSGDQAQAQGCYRKVLLSNAHNPTNAFARPVAKKKLAGGN